MSTFTPNLDPVLKEAECCHGTGQRRVIPICFPGAPTPPKPTPVPDPIPKPVPEPSPEPTPSPFPEPVPEPPQPPPEPSPKPPEPIEVTLIDTDLIAIERSTHRQNPRKQ